MKGKPRDGSKNPGGRPSKKDSLDLGMIETLYGFGLIDEQIAELLKIAPNTIKNWNKDEMPILRAKPKD